MSGRKVGKGERRAAAGGEEEGEEGGKEEKLRRKSSRGGSKQQRGLFRARRSGAPGRRGDGLAPLLTSSPAFGGGVFFIILVLIPRVCLFMCVF